MSEPEFAVASLPGGLSKPTFLMNLHAGRDQVAMAVKNVGWEKFEAPFPEYFLKCAQVWTGLIIDIGANTGFYTLLGASASPLNHVLSFEPDSSIMQMLKENVNLNDLTRRVRFSETAMSDCVGTATFYIPSQDHGLVETSGSLESNFKSEHSELRHVRVDALDNILSSGAFSATPVSMIKIDVEGHEPHVLQGARSVVKKWRPIVYVEILANADMAHIGSFFANLGYVDIALCEKGLIIDRDNVRFYDSAWNHAFVPAEKVAAFSGLSANILGKDQQLDQVVTSVL